MVACTRINDPGAAIRRQGSGRREEAFFGRSKVCMIGTGAGGATVRRRRIVFAFIGFVFFPFVGLAFVTLLGSVVRLVAVGACDTLSSGRPSFDQEGRVVFCTFGSIVRGMLGLTSFLGQETSND